MINNITPRAAAQKLRKKSWLTSPSPGHLVQFYKSEDKLLSPLTQYVRSGLTNGDTCIVIATDAHIKSLNARLDAAGQDVLAAYLNGSYVTLHADETLAQFMDKNTINRDKFFSVIGGVVKQAAKIGKPIRAYGEMVALLWKTANKEAVIELESLWNELAETYTFSLYCAYPELHFIMDKSAQDDIRQHHTLSSFGPVTAL